MRYLLVALLALWGCDDSASVGELGEVGASSDVGSLDQTVSRFDLGVDGALPDGATADGALPDALLPDAAPPEPGPPRVEIDLAAELEPVPGAMGMARVWQSESVDDLVGGQAATGRIGDWILQNDSVRVVVEGVARESAVCPYGGNIIDGDIRRDCAPDCGQDVVGEVCLLLTAAQTTAAADFEIIQDGNDGGAAVLAVSSDLQLLDFINVVGVARDFLPNIQLGYDTETLMPLRITTYYIIRPGDQGVRVVTALRNDGAQTLHVPAGHLIDSGGNVDFFNPLGPYGGFGYASLSAASLSGSPLLMLAFQGLGAGYMYLPDATPEMVDDGFPTGGRYITISGVAVTLLGVSNVITTLLAAPPQHPNLAGLLHIEPGTTETIRHWHLIGDASLSTMLDAAWGITGIETGVAQGLVSADGEPQAGVKVTAVDQGDRTVGQVITGDDGTWIMRVPVGATIFRAYHASRALTMGAADVVAADPVTVDMNLPADGALHIMVRRPDGAPTPARVTIECDGPCPAGLTSKDRDVTFDNYRGDTGLIEFLDMTGEATIPLAPGDYHVSVTRGFEWSVWPESVIEDGHGELVTIGNGETVELTAEIAHVVSTAGAISADFHVHAINSPDAPTENAQRVRTFLGEGLDVLVSTDHDFITDFNPIIEALEATEELINVLGCEITTFDYGHFNGFPLQRDDTMRNGGALDWSNGPEAGLSPEQIFNWIHDQPGVGVAMLNHAGSTFKPWKADVLRGRTLTDPTIFRIGGLETVDGDTGMWSERFTAMELLNGANSGEFWGLTRWWMTMVSRGFTPSATAVSDTHKQAKSQGGEARSYVFVEGDTPATFDQEAFALAVNEGRMLGTNGPFFQLTAHAGDAVAGPGDTIEVLDGGQVTFRVHIEMAEWMHVDTIEVFTNVDAEALLTEPGVQNNDPLEPTMTVPIPFAEDQLVIAAEGDRVHRRRRITVEFEVEADEDRYVVVMVRDRAEGGRGMYPVHLDREVRALAFMNPIYIDADGNGFDHPPLAELAATPAPERSQQVEPPRMLERRDVELLIRETAHNH